MNEYCYVGSGRRVRREALRTTPGRRISMRRNLCVRGGNHFHQSLDAADPNDPAVIAVDVAAATITDVVVVDYYILLSLSTTISFPERRLFFGPQRN